MYIDESDSGFLQKQNLFSIWVASGKRQEQIQKNKNKKKVQSNQLGSFTQWECGGCVPISTKPKTTTASPIADCKARLLRIYNASKASRQVYENNFKQKKSIPSQSFVPIFHRQFLIILVTAVMMKRQIFPLLLL